jgi:hypothetical protein
MSEQSILSAINPFLNGSVLGNGRSSSGFARRSVPAAPRFQNPLPRKQGPPDDAPSATHLAFEAEADTAVHQE